MDQKKRIYVVFKTHFDIGFTDLARNVVKRYGKMLADAVQTCESTKKHEPGHRYVWTMSSWPLIQSLDPQTAGPDTVAKAKTLIREGQITWHALPFTTHTEFCGLEEFIRGLYLSRNLSEEYGRWPLSAKMTDVPGHTWILPSLLHKAGVRFLHLGCNPGSTPPDVPRLFYWEGPDGGRVLTFYSKGDYGSTLLPPDDWPYPVWLALMQTGDNLGPQGPEIIDEIVATIAKEMPDAAAVIGTLDDFYEALVPHAAGLPVIRGDLADSWIHGVGTYPREVAKLRALRHALVDIEKALSLGIMGGAVTEEEVRSCRQSIAKAFERCLLFGEHTWGLDVKSTMGYNRHYRKEAFLRNRQTAAYRLMEESWDEQRGRVEDAALEVRETARIVLGALARCAGGAETCLTVFNGLGWRRDAWVSLDEFRTALAGKELVDDDTLEPVLVTEIAGSLRAYVKGLPALGQKTLHVKAGSEGLAQKEARRGGVRCVYDYDARSGILENQWYRLEVDGRTGTITSLFDKVVGKEWVNAGRPVFGRYRYDVYGDTDVTEFIRSYVYRFYDWIVNDLGRMAYPVQKHLTFVLKDASFSVTGKAGNGYGLLALTSELMDESVTEYGNAAKVTISIILYEDQPYIDLTYTLNDKKETPFIEAGHVVFPLNVKNPRFHINKLGSVVDPATDVVKDANHALYCVENWVDISDGEAGLAVIPFDTPLFSLGDQKIYKYQREYVETEPTLFFNLFNNSWGTNFPQWMGGDYTFRFRLLSHRGDWREAEVAKRALESVMPPLVGFAAGGEVGDAVREACRFLEWMTETDGVEIQALKPAENGKGFILRVREIQGVEREVRLAFARRLSRIAGCDLLEREQGDLAFDADQISFHTRPFEVHTLFLAV